MNYRLLVVFIEGGDEERLFNRTLKCRFEESYDYVQPWKYREKKKERVKCYLDNIKKMGADYVYLADINDTPCVSKRKQVIQRKLDNVDKDRIIVVKREIEGWYLAGLDAEHSKKLRIPPCTATDSITKEQFDALVPRKFDSRIDFMQEILNHFCVETAKQNNKSFKYFLEKHGL